MPVQRWDAYNSVHNLLIGMLTMRATEICQRNQLCTQCTSCNNHFYSQAKISQAFTTKTKLIKFVGAAEPNEIECTLFAFFSCFTTMTFMICSARLCGNNKKIPLLTIQSWCRLTLCDGVARYPHRPLSFSINASNCVLSFVASLLLQKFSVLWSWVCVWWTKIHINIFFPLLFGGLTNRRKFLFSCVSVWQFQSNK